MAKNPSELKALIQSMLATTMFKKPQETMPINFKSNLSPKQRKKRKIKNNMARMSRRINRK